MDASTEAFEARTRRMVVLIRFVSWDTSPGEDADDELKSAHNLAVEASYHAIRQLALETCTICKPSLLNDLSRDSETRV